MAHDSQALTIEAGDWGPDADVWLSKALAHSTLDDLRGQVQAGASLFYFKHEAVTVGALLLRVDGDEGVIVAAAVELSGVDMMGTCMPAIERMFIGCKTVRYHTNNPAVLRKMARHGYRPREIIAVKDI